MKKFGLRKKKVFAPLFCFLFIALLIFWYIQNFTFTVTKTSIISAKVTDEITIVQLSDLHGAVFGKNNKSLIAAVEKQQPDLICVTGDMYTSGDTEEMDTAIRLMKSLPSIAPVYFVPGEHDQDERYLKALSAAGITVMSYHMDTVVIKGNSVTMYGIDNVYYTDTFNLFYEFDEPAPDSFNIMLAHIPNFEAFNWFGPDLTLCGDTHGGVVQIPFLGPMYFNGRWFPELTSEDESITDKGLFNTYTGHIYVSGGLGNYPYPLRLFNRPELSVIKISPQE